MNRFTAISALLAAWLAADNRAHPAEPDTAGLPITIGSREPTDDDLALITKRFLVAMRDHHGDRNANALRPYFDPRYLKDHDLTDGDLSVQMAPVGDILNYKFADDRRTVLCIVETKANGQAPVKEAILLRLSVNHGRLYVSPLKAPDLVSGSFTPWVLRTKI